MFVLCGGQGCLCVCVGCRYRLWMVYYCVSERLCLCRACLLTSVCFYYVFVLPVLVYVYLSFVFIYLSQSTIGIRVCVFFCFFSTLNRGS